MNYTKQELALQALYQYTEMRIYSKIKLNKVWTTEFFNAKPKTMRNFEDNMAEEDLTWFTTGQSANYGTDLHEPLITYYVCFVTMTNIDPTYRHIST